MASVHAWIDLPQCVEHGVPARGSWQQLGGRAPTVRKLRAQCHPQR
eukprot:SAG11_NODE_28280_length_323_cov_1.156250_1_plen_45_part_10